MKCRWREGSNILKEQLQSEEQKGHDSGETLMCCQVFRPEDVIYHSRCKSVKLTLRKIFWPFWIVVSLLTSHLNIMLKQSRPRCLAAPTVITLESPITCCVWWINSCDAAPCNWFEFCLFVRDWQDRKRRSDVTATNNERLSCGNRSDWALRKTSATYRAGGKVPPFTSKSLIGRVDFESSITGNSQNMFWKETEGSEKEKHSKQCHRPAGWIFSVFVVQRDASKTTCARVAQPQMCSTRVAELIFH